MVGVIYPTRKAQTWMPLEKIPRAVIDAVMTAEDRRFWTHPGIDLVAVARRHQNGTPSPSCGFGLARGSV